MQALIATLNPSVRRKFFDFNSKGERYLMMTSDEVWKKWEAIFKLHRLGDLKDVVTGKPLRLAQDWEYKPVGSSVREVSGLTDGEIGELASRILDLPAKVYLQPPPKDSKKRAKVHRAQSMKEWCVRKKQKKVVLREVQRRVNHVRGDESYSLLNFNIYDMECNAVQYGDWEFVKSKNGLTSYHMDYLLRSAGSAFFLEQHKRPVSVIERLHMFTKAIDQVLVTRERVLHLHSVPGLAIEYLYGEKRYADVMMQYSRTQHRRISSTPSYKRSEVLISDFKVGCIIADCRNFPIHPNEQIDILTERTLLAGLEAVADADMTELRALLCITTKHRAQTVKRMSTIASTASSDSEEGVFQVRVQQNIVEASDYKQAQYRIEHRNCEFVAELRMELYLRYIDQFCEAKSAVILMHAGTKAIQACRMLGRVCISLHDLQSCSRPAIFGDAFKERLTMIPRAFFYNSPSPLTTRLPKFHLKTAFGEKVAVGCDPPSDAELEGSGDIGDISGRMSPRVPIEVNCSSHNEELVHQTTSVGTGNADNCSEPQHHLLEGSSDNDAAKSGNDEEDEGDSKGSGKQFAGFDGNDNEGIKPDASEDDLRDEEECRIHPERAGSEDRIREPLPRTPPTRAPIVGALPGVASQQSWGGSHAMLQGQGLIEETVLRHPAILNHLVAGRDESQVQAARSEEWGGDARTTTAELLEQQPRGARADSEGPYTSSAPLDVAALGAHGRGKVAPPTSMVALISSMDCVPATPKPQTVGLQAEVPEDANLENLLEQGTPPEHSMNVDELITTTQMNAAIEDPLASRGQSSHIDLDEVDDKEMEKSMAELSAMAIEMRRGVVVKTEPVDALQPLFGGCSHNVESQSTVDVKPNVADVWRTTIAEGSTARKRKREVDALMANQARLLEIVSDLMASRKKDKEDMASQKKEQEDMMNRLLHLQSEIAFLRKYGPSAGPMDSIRPDQQSQLFSTISSGVSPVGVGDMTTVPSPELQVTPEAARPNLVSTTISAVSGEDVLNLT